MDKKGVKRVIPYWGEVALGEKIPGRQWGAGPGILDTGVPI